MEKPDNPLPASSPRVPSARISAALAAAMLAIGVAVGAAIGPAPGASFANVSRLPLLLSSLAGERSSGAPASTQPLPITPRATPAAGRAKGTGTSTPGSGATSQSSSSMPGASTPSASVSPTSGAGGSHHTAASLPPVTRVWLIELSGGSFAEALAQTSAAPYINTQAVPSGALLNSWSAIAGDAFATDAALLASTPPQLVQTVVQPPCPEGAAGAGCAVGTPGALTAADEFLKQTVTAITANASYRSNGLIVITFTTIAAGAAAGLPDGSTTATFTSEAPAGVLLISPFVTAGARPSTAFAPASPKQSLEKLLHQ